MHLPLKSTAQGKGPPALLTLTFYRATNFQVGESSSFVTTRLATKAADFRVEPAGHDIAEHRLTEVDVDTVAGASGGRGADVPWWV